MQKHCPRCNKYLDESKFYKRNLKTKTILQSICKNCSSKQSSVYHKANKDKRHSQRKEDRKRKRQWLIEFKKTKKCINCGNDKWYCLEFHHTSKEKDGNISKLIQERSITKVKKEIEKCIILCANCHREVHHGDYSVGVAQ